MRRRCPRCCFWRRAAVGEERIRDGLRLAHPPPTDRTYCFCDRLLAFGTRADHARRARIAALPAIPGGRLKDWRQQRAAVEARLNRYQAAMSPRLSHWRTASATYAHNVLPPRPDQPGVEDGPHLPGIGYRSTASGFRDLWGYSGTYTDHDFAIHYGWVAAVTGLLPAVVLPRSLRRFRTDPAPGGGPLRHLWLRPPRHAQPLPRMRGGVRQTPRPLKYPEISNRSPAHYSDRS